jgi:hypothetical protein
MRYFTYIVLLFVVLGSVACGGAQNPMSTFDREVDQFHAHMRWGRWSMAALSLDESIRADFEGEFDERGEDFNVTEFEVEGTSWTDSSNCTVTVWMQWYQLPNTRVEEATWEEDWAYDDDDRRWVVMERRKID